MEHKSKLKPLIQQFSKFAVIGFMNTILNLILTYFFIFIFKNKTSNETSLTFLTNFAGFTITTLNSYYFNNRFVFKKTKKGHLWPLTKTYICYGSTFLLGFVLTNIFTNIMGLSVFMVPALSLAITVPLNFLINKFWSFA